MEWTTYALVACGSMAFICLVMGGIEHFVWREWDRSQRAAHLASLEEEVRRLRQECKVAYADGYDNGHADGYEEGKKDGFFLGAGAYDSDTAIDNDGQYVVYTGVFVDSDPTPSQGMDRPSDLI